MAAAIPLADERPRHPTSPDGGLGTDSTFKRLGRGSEDAHALRVAVSTGEGQE